MGYSGKKKKENVKTRQPLSRGSPLQIIRGGKLIIIRCTSTRMAEAGIDVKVLQVIMGHARADVTMNIYNHVDLRRMTKEMERIETSEQAVLMG